VGEVLDLLVADHPGGALDRVDLAEEQVYGAGRRPAGLDREQHLDRAVEPSASFVAEDLHELGVRRAHAAP